ncbi:hypothetical protein HPB47_006361, partial [Ixodes persulcatus]
VTRNMGPRIAVLGAGVVGLSTALCLQRTIPKVSVTVIADQFIEDTLSFGAGGFFRPDLNIGPTYDVTRRWYRETFMHYERLLKDNLGEAAGIKRLSGFALSSISSDVLTNELMKELCSGLRALSPEEMTRFPEKYNFGIFYSSILADPRKYLQWLTDRITESGGHFTKKVVQSLQEVGKEFDIVVNCTGLRAKELTEDFLLTPIRGQAIKIHAPWVTQFFYADGCYVLPGTEYVTLGGIKQFGDWNMQVSQHDRKYIWENCVSVVPSLKDGKVVQDWVGLRPFRQPIRVEAELLGFAPNQCKHCAPWRNSATSLCCTVLAHRSIRWLYYFSTGHGAVGAEMRSNC